MKLLIWVIPALLLVSQPVLSNEPVTAAQAGTITGSVYCDLNKDGKCDCEEKGLKGIQIKLFSKQCGGTPLETVQTDARGNFSLHVSVPGRYFVSVDLDYVCGGRVPTTTVCQETELLAGTTVQLEPFGYSGYGE